MGAWIEIGICDSATPLEWVAPLVGAWIEIHVVILVSFALSWSLPSWERGLKYGGEKGISIPLWSLPSWERGLKTVYGGSTYTVFSRSPRGSVD